jgi:hypothetical protein
MQPPFVMVLNRETHCVGYPKERKNQMGTGLDSIVEEPLQVSWNRKIRS